MGLKDRLGAARRWMWSPMTIDMLNAGSDPLVRAGHPATVRFDVVGESDGTGTHIDVLLVLGHTTTVKLAEEPPTLGRHEVRVVIPEGFPPSSRFSEYRFQAVLQRTKGSKAEAVSLVDYAIRPEDLYWPEGPRSAGPEIVLEADVVDVGESVRGRTTPGARLEVGTLIEKLEPVAGKNEHQLRERFTAVAKVTAGPDGSFAAEVPEGAPPTLQHESTRVIWQVRAGEDHWRTFGVLDPECKGSDRNTKAQSLIDLFG